MHHFLGIQATVKRSIAPRWEGRGQPIGVTGTTSASTFLGSEPHFFTLNCVPRNTVHNSCFSKSSMRKFTTIAGSFHDMVVVPGGYRFSGKAKPRRCCRWVDVLERRGSEAQMA